MQQKREHFRSGPDGSKVKRRRAIDGQLCIQICMKGKRVEQELDVAVTSAVMDDFHATLVRKLDLWIIEPRPELAEEIKAIVLGALHQAEVRNRGRQQSKLEQDVDHFRMSPRHREARGGHSTLVARKQIPVVETKESEAVHGTEIGRNRDQTGPMPQRPKLLQQWRVTGKRQIDPLVFDDKTHQLIQIVTPDQIQKHGDIRAGHLFLPFHTGSGDDECPYSELGPQKDFL
jgi:hypothetical protein